MQSADQGELDEYNCEWLKKLPGFMVTVWHYQECMYLIYLIVFDFYTIFTLAVQLNNCMLIAVTYSTMYHI